MANIEQQHHHVSSWAGWIGFAGILMNIAGIFHIIFGIGGLFAHDWYITSNNSAYLFDVSSWGWSMIVVGVLLMISASLLVTGNMAGRIIGGLLALSGLVINAALIPATPVWSILLMLVNAMVLYAIIAHGKEMKYLDE